MGLSCFKNNAVAQYVNLALLKRVSFTLTSERGHHTLFGKFSFPSIQGRPFTDLFVFYIYTI